MELRYSHKAELLYSLLVAMITVLPWQQGYLLIRIATKNICAKYEVKLLSFGSVLHNSLVAMVTIFPYQQGKPVIATLLKKVSTRLE